MKLNGSPPNGLKEASEFIRLTQYLACKFHKNYFIKMQYDEEKLTEAWEQCQKDA